MKKKKEQLIFPAIKIILRIIKLSEEALRETLFTGQQSMACYCKMRHFDVHLHTDTSKGDMYLYCLNGKNPAISFVAIYIYIVSRYRAIMQYTF